MRNHPAVSTVSLATQIPDSFQKVFDNFIERIKKAKYALKGWLGSAFEIRILVNNITIVYDVFGDDTYKIVDKGSGQFMTSNLDQELNEAARERVKIIKKQIFDEWNINSREVVELQDIFKPENFAKAIQCKEFYISNKNPDLSFDFAKACYGYRNNLEQEKILDNANLAVRKNVEKAQDYAVNIGYQISSIRKEYESREVKLTFDQLAKILNERNIPTPRKKSSWVGSSVFRIEKTFISLCENDRELVHHKLHKTQNQPA